MADQTGGKLIDQGKYGCVFDTMPKCLMRRAKSRREGGVGSGTRKTLRVTKIVKPGDKTIENEIRIARALSKLPGYNDYFILVDDVCEGDDITGDPDWSACRLFAPDKKRLAKFVQLRMVYGGERLTEYARNIERLLQNWLSIQIHIFEGLRLLHSNRWIHGDLHFGNILVDEKNVPRLIDFGLGYNINLIKEKDVVNLRFMPSYDNYAPEFDYVAGLQKGLAADSIMEIIYNQKHILREIDETFPGRYSVQEDMKFFGARSPVVGAAEVKTFIQQYARAGDIWTIGYNFYRLYMMMITFPVVIGSEFYRTLHREQMNLLRGLLHVDPRRRLTADQALTELYTMKISRSRSSGF
jgi:serine/threonine protein kinase